MSYEELIRDTSEMTKRMELKWDIISAMLLIMLAVMIILLAMVLWQDHKDRKAQADVDEEYKPQVLPDVQIGPDGTEYHRMGVPGKE